jgi:uncharacterized protein (DUF2147 family)
MLALAFSAAMALATSAPEEAIEGYWLHPDGAIIIRVDSCGDAYCGTVTWATKRASLDAKTGVDSLIGAQLLSGFHQNSSGVWKGQIYIPDQDMHVSGKLKPLDSNRLMLSGCTFGGLLCKTQIWTRSGRPIARAD